MGIQDRDYYWEDRNPDGSRTAKPPSEPPRRSRRPWYIPVLLALRRCFPADFGQWHWSLTWIWWFAVSAGLIGFGRLLRWIHSLH